MREKVVPHRKDLPDRGRSPRVSASIRSALVLAALAVNHPAPCPADPTVPHPADPTAGARRGFPTTDAYWSDDPAFGHDPRTLAAAGPTRAERSPAGIRGVTVGPIESSVHPNRGYGTPAYERTLDELGRMGANWVSLTPYGRVADLRPTGIDPTFEAPFLENRQAIKRAIEQAHARGFRVLLVPHLWVETGDWRGEINPGTSEGWARWADAYKRYLLTWAEVAEQTGVDMLSVGVELGTWVATSRVATFRPIISEVRRVYHGPLTYSANWDDIDATLLLGSLDVIGINAFYPLADKDGAGWTDLRKGAQEIAGRVHKLAALWNKPIVFTELGYTTRQDPAVRPWLWPDRMQAVRIDQAAQALAYRALIAPMLDEPGFLGFFVWRVYADPDDVSQEAEWGFSPRGKLAEQVMRDAFHAAWACDGPGLPGAALGRPAAEIAGVF